MVVRPDVNGRAFDSACQLCREFFEDGLLSCGRRAGRDCEEKRGGIVRVQAGVPDENVDVIRIQSLPILVSVIRAVIFYSPRARLRGSKAVCPSALSDAFCALPRRSVLPVVQMWHGSSGFEVCASRGASS